MMPVSLIGWWNSLTAKQVEILCSCQFPCHSRFLYSADIDIVFPQFSFHFRNQRLADSNKMLYNNMTNCICQRIASSLVDTRHYIGFLQFGKGKFRMYLFAFPFDFPRFCFTMAQYLSIGLSSGSIEDLWYNVDVVFCIPLLSQFTVIAKHQIRPKKHTTRIIFD